METLIIDIEKDRVQELKAILDSMNISFHKKKEKPYNPEFVAKIEQGKKDLADGKGIKMSIAEMEALWK